MRPYTPWVALIALIFVACILRSRPKLRHPLRGLVRGVGAAPRPASDFEDEYLRTFRKFQSTPPVSLGAFRRDAECVLRSEQVGLNVAHEACWNGADLFVRCPQRSDARKYEMDDFGQLPVQLLPGPRFDAAVRGAGAVQRVNGSAFLMTSHLWPHNIQHVWPALNVPGLGLRLAAIGVFGPMQFGTRGAQHPYSSALIGAVAAVYNLTMMPPAADFFRPHLFWRQYKPQSLLCFEAVVVPNKGPSPKFGTHTGAFADPFVVARHKRFFLDEFYKSVRRDAGNRSLPDALPARPPMKALFLNRAERSGRRILNADAVVRAVARLGVPVEVAEFESLTLAQQFMRLAHTGLLLSPHGGNLVNALLLPPGAVAVELYPLPARYTAGEWSEYLQQSGTKCVEFCDTGRAPGRRCPPAPAGPYPRNNGRIDVRKLRPLLEAVVNYLNASAPR